MGLREVIAVVCVLILHGSWWFHPKSRGFVSVGRTSFCTPRKRLHFFEIVSKIPDHKAEFFLQTIIPPRKPSWKTRAGKDHLNCLLQSQMAMLSHSSQACISLCLKSPWYLLSVCFLFGFDLFSLFLLFLPATRRLFQELAPQIARNHPQLSSQNLFMPINVHLFLCQHCSLV